MNLNPIKAYHLEPFHWGTIFATLSLDLVIPYVSSMALQLPPDGKFPEGLRELIREYRKQEQKDRAAELRFATAAFDWIQAGYGSGFSEHLYRWGLDVFQAGANTSASAGAFLWDNIICYGKLDGSRDMVEPPGFVRAVRAAMSRPISSVNRIQPSTQWDREIYQRHGYGEMRNPMEFVQATINYCSFVSAWAEAMKQHGPAQDWGTITQWAFKVADFLGMPKDRIGQPGAWKPLPPAWLK